MPKIGIAISGGGHRATLFGLGVLLYLADVGKNQDVSAISSVSGGSLTNAYVGLNASYPDVDKAGFRDLAARLAGQIANRGSLFAWMGTKLYLAALVAGFAASLLVWLLPWHWVLRLLLQIAALAVWEVLLVRQRGRICGSAYAATLFGGRPPLDGIARDRIDHVLCATHMNAGEHMYFSGRFVYAYRFGWAQPGDLPLHVAVQASTALPGAFPPRWIRTRSLYRDEAGSRPRWIALVDGGVYDNMADQWLSGLEARRDVPAGVQQPEMMIIANASASMQLEAVGSLRWPLIGEILALKRDTSIMYDNSASIRKSDLIDRFDAHAQAPEASCARPGVLLDIASDPFAAAEYFKDAAAVWPERAQRAVAVLTKKPDDWISDAAWAAGVGTNLSKLGVDTSARLLRHAYLLAAMNLHLFAGFRLIDPPDLSEFEALCSR
jgi:hypothetical protein